jgi:hypothetical protein
MANVDAFNQGFDAGMGKKKTNKGKKKTDKGDKEFKNSKEVNDIRTSDGQELTPSAMPSTFKRGGKVKRTGVAKVHRGEIVLTALQAKKYHKKASRKRVSQKG